MKVYYINLNHRTDRRHHIENEFKTHGITSYERIEGVHVPIFGILGCVLSHIKTLEKFLSECEDEYCIIFEDDFKFTRDFKNEFKLPDFEWDILMLSGNILKSEEYSKGFKRILDAQTTSGYIVTRKFAPTLLKNFKDGRYLLEKTGIREKFSLDIYWKLLQPFAKWYVCEPKFGIQLPSYSDIENFFADYKV